MNNKQTILSEVLDNWTNDMAVDYHADNFYEGEKTPIYSAMDQYAKEIAIEFTKHVCGSLPLNIDPHKAVEIKAGSVESELMMMNTTIDKRFEQFKIEKGL